MRLLSIKCFVFIAILGVGKLQAQSFRMPGSGLSGSLFEFTEPSFYVSLSANNSRFLSRGVQFWGIGIGVESKQGVSLEVTYNWMDSRVLSSAFHYHQAIERLYVRYLGFLGAYRFFQKGKLSSVFETTIGGGNVIFSSLSGEVRDRARIVVLEPAVRLHYDILPWLSFGLMMGWRMTGVEDPMRARQISSGKIDIGLSISPMRLMKAMKAG